MVEHLTFNQVVGGSNPPCLTKEWRAENREIQGFPLFVTLEQNLVRIAYCITAKVCYTVTVANKYCSQSRHMRVKCRLNRELSARRKDFLAVHESHPAASEDRNIISSCSMMRSAKEVIFL